MSVLLDDGTVVEEEEVSEGEVSEGEEEEEEEEDEEEREERKFGVEVTRDFTQHEYAFVTVIAKNEEEARDKVWDMDWSDFDWNTEDWETDNSEIERVEEL